MPSKQQSHILTPECGSPGDALHIVPPHLHGDQNCQQIRRIVLHH
jgi:hypothetical protein